MPDIDSIMSVWPEKVENQIKLKQNLNNGEINIPSQEEMGLNLEEYSKMICNMFHIPVHVNEDNKKGKNKDNNLIQSLLEGVGIYAL